MSITAGTILAVNAGSSSVKLAVFALDSSTNMLSRLASISISNIGQSKSILQITLPTNSTRSEEVVAPNHTQALDRLVEELGKVVPTPHVGAIGHRLVHGGLTYTSPVSVASISEEDWRFLSQLDPLHTLAARQIASQLGQHYPSIPQVACFDTAFFDELPEVAKIIPIPKEYYQKGVRRYGFHGLSYTSLLSLFREKAGETAAQGRVILAHLGSGASLAATRSGKPVDMTMSLTPASGIAMSTRSGDLDPAVFSFLHHKNNMSTETFDHMVNFESGLLGVSGITGDMRALLGMEKQNKDAAMAVELFVHDVKKSIGALSAVLGGIDSLLFSGGIGEQSAVLRARICQGLEYLGIDIDKTANEQHSFLISAAQSKTGVHVIPTDEARIIAEQTIELLASQKDSYGVN